MGSVCFLVARLAFFASLARIACGMSIEMADQSSIEITGTRLRIYQNTIQALAIETARGLGNGVVASLPILPFGGNGTKQEVVVLDKFTAQTQGYTWHEFILPPGVKFNTTDGQVILLYQSFENVNAPVAPPSGYTLQTQVVSLSCFGIGALNLPTSDRVAVIAPATQPISVIFPTPDGGPSSLCSTFNASGIVLPVPTKVQPTSITCSPQNIGAFTVLKQNPLPPAPAPAPAPGGSLAPPPESTTTPPPQGTQPSPPTSEPPPPETNSTSSSGSNATALGIGLGVGLGVPLVLLAAFGAWYAVRAVERRNLEHMEMESDKKASLETAIVGGSRAPAAGALRTKPYLESEDLTTDRI